MRRKEIPLQLRRGGLDGNGAHNEDVKLARDNSYRGSDMKALARLEADPWAQAPSSERHTSLSEVDLTRLSNDPFSRRAEQQPSLCRTHNVPTEI
jgi:hypothetical protein